MPKVHFLNEDVVAEARPGESIKDVADRLGIQLVRGLLPWAHCRGHGLCGRCRVWAMPRAAGAVSPLAFFERLRRYRGSRRLACQTRVLGDVEVRTTPNAQPPQQTTEWLDDGRPSKWKERAAGEAKAAAARIVAEAKAAAEARAAATQAAQAAAAEAAEAAKGEATTRPPEAEKPTPGSSGPGGA